MRDWWDGMRYRYQYNRYYGPLNPGKDNRMSQRQAERQSGEKGKIITSVKNGSKKKKIVLTEGHKILCLFA